MDDDLGVPLFLETPICFYTLLGTNIPPFENEKSYVSSVEGTANGFYHEIPVKQDKKSFLLIHFTNQDFSHGSRKTHSLT